MDLKRKLQIKHAELLVKQGRLWELLYEDLGTKYDDSEQAEEQQPELYFEYKNAEAELNVFEQELRTYPEFFDELVMWMVDVIGYSDNKYNAKEIFSLFEKLKNMPDAVANHDNIAALIKEYLTYNGFIITDFGGGAGEWHIGVPCTENESRKMIRLLRNDFREFFEENVLALSRWTYGPRWKNLLSWDDAEKFLKA